MASKGDPRRPENITELPHVKLDPEDLPVDYWAILSLLFGIGGLMMRYKVSAWLALFSCVASLANMKTAQMDVKQVLASVT